jgi:hypothetical protein
MHTRRFSRQTENVTGAGGTALVGSQSDSDPNARRHMSDIPSDDSLVSGIFAIEIQSAVLSITRRHVLPRALHPSLQPSDGLNAENLGSIVGLAVDHDGNCSVGLLVARGVEVARASHSSHGCAHTLELLLWHMMLEIGGAVVVRKQTAARAIALQQSFDDEEACNRQNDEQDDLPDGQIIAFTFSVHCSSDMYKAA